MSELPSGRDGVLSELFLRADRAYEAWVKPRIVNPREHDRPFYPSGEPRGYVLAGLPLLHGRSCDQEIKQQLQGKPHITVLDLCCGTGHAAWEIARRNYGVKSYGLTAGSFHHPYRLGSAMKLPEAQLIYGNTARLKQVMDARLPGQKFDVIYSFQGLPYVPLPILYIIEQVYDLLRPGGVAFLERGSHDDIHGYRELIWWLKNNDYDFEFTTGLNLPGHGANLALAAIRKTQPTLEFPVIYSPNGACYFRRP